MTSEEIQGLIIADLRASARGLDHWQIAGSICQAPFRVRAELRTLGREGLARELPGDQGWLLTARGLQRAYEGDQLQIRAIQP